MGLFLMFCFLAALGAFLMAWYLHFGWSILFNCFAVAGAVGFWAWRRREMGQATQTHI